MKEKSVISLKDIQRVYEKMYSEIRKYIWSFEAIHKLADLEISAYNRFPDLEDVKLKFYALKELIYPTILEDEDLEKAVDNFEKVINSAKDVYAKLISVREDITDED